jgi:ADP-heptose:LPS heptosyltransferase
VALPFIASVLKESHEVRLLLISRFGNVGVTILPHLRECIATIEPFSFRSLYQQRALLGINRTEKIPGKVLFAAQSGVNSVSKLKYLFVIRSMLGTQIPIIGLGKSQQLRTHDQCEAKPDEMSVNVALAPFIACGITPKASRDDCKKLLAITDKENDEVDQTLNRLRVKYIDSPGIAFYVHAKDKRKRWPLDRFITVARKILDDYDQNIVLIGGSEDRDISEAVARELPADRVIVVAGLLSVRGTLALLSRCNLFVGNDGSPTHMAAIQGCRCVTIYCNWEVAGFWEPIAAPASVSLRPVWSTERYKENFGIENIPIDGVVNAVKTFLSSSTIEPVHRVEYYDSGVCVSKQIITERVLVDEIVPLTRKNIF